MKVRYRKKLVLKNSLETGVVFYGLHMSEGIAHYKPHGEEPFTVFVGNQTIKLMNSTFQGKPVYVGHVDEHTKLTDADGVVSDSFYNKADGKHWCKFVVTTQKGLDAVSRGWKLSNSLVVDSHSVGGVHHGLDFDRTVDRGSFHHLAIVPNPRYEESDILTPEQFKQYNNTKEAELIRLSNSKENEMKFQMFKKTKVDNSKEVNLAEITVHLPKSKRDVTLEQLCNEADEEKPAPKEGEESSEESSEESKFDLDGAMVSLKELIKMYKDLKSQFDSLEIVADEVEGESEEDIDQLNNSEDEEDDDLDDSGDLDEDDLDAHDAELAAQEAAEAKAAKLDNSKTVKTPAKKINFAKKIKNAAEVAEAKAASSTKFVVDLGTDQAARGQSRYGKK